MKLSAIIRSDVDIFMTNEQLFSNFEESYIEDIDIGHLMTAMNISYSDYISIRQNYILVEYSTDNKQTFFTVKNKHNSTIRFRINEEIAVEKDIKDLGNTEKTIYIIGYKKIASNAYIIDIEC